VAAGTGLHRCVPVGFKYFEFEFKKLKNETKILKNTSRFIESNSVKFFANLVDLVFFFDHYNISRNRKRKKIPRPIRPKRRGRKYPAEKVYFTSLDIAMSTRFLHRHEKRMNCLPQLSKP
jgi:hypothetical protein